VYYENNGATSNTQGRLYLSGGSYGSGSYATLLGSTTTFVSAVVNPNAIITADSTSTVEFAGGQSFVLCSFNNTGRLLISGGRTQFPQAIREIQDNNSDVYASLTSMPLQPTTLAATLQVSGGVLDLATWDTDLPPLILDGGGLTGSGVLSIVRASTWTAGSMSGTGKTLVQPGTTLTMSGSTTKSLGRLLRNLGSVRIPLTLG
jgi:hypothetical protein